MWKVFDWIQNTITENDLYYKKVTLRYKGKESFKSLYGGIVSTIIILFLFIDFIILTSVIFTYGDSTHFLKTIIKDLVDDKTLHYI